MDKKKIAGALALLLMAALAVIIISDYSGNKTKPNTIATANGLDEAQIVACDAATEGDTCHTKLSKLTGLVTASECCQKLGKCC